MTRIEGYCSKEYVNGLTWGLGGAWGLWFKTIVGGAAFFILSMGVTNSMLSAEAPGDEPSQGAAPSRESPQASVQQSDGRVRISFDGKTFTEYRFRGYPKPIFYPILGPGGTQMTRNFPMKKGVAGEAPDHPHHESLWFTHGDVNGVDFWTVREGSGKIVQEDLSDVEVKGNTVQFRSKNRWVKPDGSVVCRDTRTMRISATPDARMIDIQVEIHAGDADVVFGDTKEGTMGIRTNPALRLSGEVAAGHARNSRGQEDGKIWGQRAEWVDYWGPVDGKPGEGRTVGVAIFDHPSNPRHPTWWHARSYGLVAANPFGEHDFEKKPAGTGDFTIPAGESRTFRYLFVFHDGDWRQARIAKRYEEWARGGEAQAGE